MSLPPTIPGPSPNPGAPGPPAGPKPGPRRPFADQPKPTPFHQSREFRFFGLVSAILIAVLLVGFYLLNTRNVVTSPRSARAVKPGTPTPAAARPPLTEEERAARDLRLHTYFEGSLLDTANGDGFSDTPGYHRLLEILKSYSAEDFMKLPRKQLDWAAAMADPGAWRGEIVEVRGVLAERYAVRLKDPVFGIQDVTQGILIEGDGTNGVFFDMIDETPPLSYREDAIDVVGIFYRTVRYPTAKPDPDAPRVEGKRQLPPYRYETPEGDVQEAPYLLVKTVTPVAKPKRDPTGILQNHRPAIMAGLGLAFAAGWLITYSVQRRTRRLRGPARARSDRPSGPFEQRLDGANRTSGPPSGA
jgi:hypothetical protein